MKIELIYIGKTDNEYLKTGINEYSKRLKHYLPFSLIEIPDIKNTKNMSVEMQKQKEGELLLAKFDNKKQVLLLDEKGKEFSSEGFAQFIDQKNLSYAGDLCFVIGGPYGFSEEVYARANQKISLSKMTFSHQMIRLLFTEQLYRAMTIIKGEPYHHK